MSTQIKLTPVALAMAALFASPLAFASDEDRDDVKIQIKNHNDAKIDYDNKAKVEIEKKVKVENEVKVKGEVRVRGDIDVDAESMALVDTKQESVLNWVDNWIVDNNAVVDGNAMQNAQGNIGLNVTAGDNNAQTNDAALSTVDAAFVFADAESFGYQKAARNSTSNFATRNTARLSGNALQNATGNIGVNVSAGNSNVQANALAASVNDSGTMAKASSYTNQVTADNWTSNTGALFQIPNVLNVTLGAQLSGAYAGSGFGGYAGSTRATLWQANNYYPDAWAVCSQGPGCNPTNPDHPTDGRRTGHIDFDVAAQGAVPNPLNNGATGGFSFDSRGSESGSLGFFEFGSVALSGVVSGQVVFLQTVFRPHTNTALLDGNALQNAQGNIGVNIAAGTNNLQRNSLAIAAAFGRGGGNGGGE